MSDQEQIDLDFGVDIEAHDDETMSITLRVHVDDVYDMFAYLGTDEGMENLFTTYGDAVGIPF